MISKIVALIAACIVAVGLFLGLAEPWELGDDMSTPMPTPTERSLTASEAEELAARWLSDGKHYVDQVGDITFVDCHEQEYNATTDQGSVTCSFSDLEGSAADTLRVGATSGHVAFVR